MASSQGCVPLFSERPYMPRDFEIYLDDIRHAIGKIQSYTVGLTRDAFDQDDRTIDAVVRKLQIIGEAAKMVPESVRANHPTVAWKKIAGLRDILAHQYFEVYITDCL